MFLKKDALRLALLDLREGFKLYHVWGLLGWQDIKQKYRRSVLGPFWITLSAAAMIGGIGLLYSRLQELCHGHGRRISSPFIG